jgi:hypothetical protein
MSAVEDDASVEIALREAIGRLERLVLRLESSDGRPLSWQQLDIVSSIYEQALFDADQLQHLLRRLGALLREQQRRRYTDAIHAQHQ